MYRRGDYPCTVKLRFTDARLIHTPHLYGQFALSLGKRALIFFSKFNPLYTPLWPPQYRGLTARFVLA